MKGKRALTLAGIFLAMAASIIILVFGIGTEDDYGYRSRFLSAGNIRQGLDLQGGVSILYEADIENPTAAQMGAANALLRARLDSRGYTEATTAQEGPRHIRVDIPGVENAETAVAQIGRAAVLTFEDRFGNVLLTGENVRSARESLDGAQWVVALEFDAEGSRLFAQATGANVGHSIFIVMDDEIVSNPVVHTTITGGSAQITGGHGGFTREEANDLATAISQGSLPFALRDVSVNNVGARLGADALRTSVIAGIIGLALVLLFMLVFYRTLGLAADIALAIYVVLFLLIISGFGITLSLPGIAGLILSIGMATDANIVIFERVREEVAAGKTLRSALRTGYRRAWPAVLDSNITTLIAGFVLFWMGTGPIMGFAQMLIIGILLSMFTSLLVTRIIMNCLMDLGLVKPAHILSKAQKEALDATQGREPAIEIVEKPIVQKRKIYFAFSAAIIALGIAVSVFHGVRGNGFFNLDVEFSGGTSFTIDIGQPFDNSEIEDIVRSITGESAPQVQQVLNTNEVLIRTTEATAERRAELIDTISERFGITSDAFTYSDVSPAVSQAMRRSAVLAIVVASVGMLLYITFRFRDVRKGLSAVLAQLHDVAVVLCIYVIFRIPLNYAFIAVMLTTLGYSINATIIIFDRIRENRTRMPKIDNASLVNISVTQTLRRTIFSTLSSFAAVLMLYVIGVSAIRDFTLPIMVGLLFGGYSSIFLSGSVWFTMLKGKKGA